MAIIARSTKSREAGDEEIKYGVNRLPEIGATVKLRDGRIGTMCVGHYAKGKGGWTFLLNFGGARHDETMYDWFFLRDIAAIRETKK